MVRLFIFIALLSATKITAQDSTLLLMLNDSLAMQAGNQTVTGTFKATQLINMPTVEAPAKKTLQFLIMHRFGKISDGAYDLFGLDNAEIRFGVDYGICNGLSVGAGRSSLDKTFDANVKYKLLKQSTGGAPVSISLYELATYTTFPRHADKPYLKPAFRTIYTTQVLVARKFNTNLSVQLSPALVHYNMVPAMHDKNNIFTLGAGGRMKLNKRVSLDVEYNFLPGNPVVSTEVYKSLSLGVDIETGGHVFQFVCTNSRGMIGPYYLTQTRGSWGNGDIYFGFNISRVFNFNK